MPVLQPIDIIVRSNGGDVEIQIGKTVLTFNHEDAFKLAQWIRYRAKEAKHYVGDKRQLINVLATLTDASELESLHANIKEI